VLKTTVKESDWGYGQGSDESRLYNPRTGKFCCVGFMCLAAGLTKEDISDIGAVATLPQALIPEELKQFVRYGLGVNAVSHRTNSADADYIYAVNDSPGKNHEQRKQELIDHARHLHVELEFEP
jgi:hypothetical protein